MISHTSAIIAKTKDLADFAAFQDRVQREFKTAESPAVLRRVSATPARLEPLPGAPRPPSIPLGRVQSARERTGPAAVQSGRSGAASPYERKCRGCPRRGSGSRSPAAD